MQKGTPAIWAYLDMHVCLCACSNFCEKILSDQPHYRDLITMLLHPTFQNSSSHGWTHLMLLCCTYRNRIFRDNEGNWLYSNLLCEHGRICSPQWNKGDAIRKRTLDRVSQVHHRNDNHQGRKVTTVLLGLCGTCPVLYLWTS